MNTFQTTYAGYQVNKAVVQSAQVVSRRMDTVFEDSEFDKSFKRLEVLNFVNVSIANGKALFQRESDGSTAEIEAKWGSRIEFNIA